MRRADKGQLRLQAHLTQQFLKARIGAQRIETRFDREHHHCPIPLLIRFLQIVQSCVLLPESQVNDGQVIGRDEVALRFFF